ncbi:MAG: hypothetical protein K2H06_02815, partial [Anaeroplasmataceae bacterium]|nr:hypothetical protein [Anaeroplasmataceae bacterium]
VSAASYDSNYMLVRSEEKKVTQDDPYAQGLCDVINLYSYYKMSTSDLIKKGHETINLKITFEGKEVDDGYQEIWIFDTGYETNPDNALAKKTDIELTRGKIQKYYTTVEEVFTLKLKDISYDYVVIRWSAHGEGNDDWYCQNVRVYFEII